MKVHEIINIDLNEGLLARGAAKFLGKPLNALLSAFGKGSAGQFFKSLTSYVDDAGKLNISSVESAYGKKIADEVANNPKLIKKIEKSAISTRRTQQFSQNIGEIKQMINATMQVGEKLISGIKLAIGAAYVSTFIMPLKQYLDNIEIAEQYVEAGQWSDADFEEFRKKEIGALIGKWTVLIVSGKVSKIPGGIIKSLPIIGGKLAPLIDSLTPAVQTALALWLSTEENARVIASALAQPLLFDISANEIAGATYYKITDAINNLIHKDQSQSATSTQPEIPPAPEQGIFN